MPRKPRLHAPGGLYHVTLRGNHRARIFRCDSDHDRLDEIVADVLARFDSRLHGYCWMPNHLHLIIQIADHPLGGIMQRIASRYARVFQARLGTTGHLFERRYHAQLVDADRYLLALLRYVHLNPVRAGIVSDPADYRWSSHRNYLGARCTAWVSTNPALALFSLDTRRARAAYVAFVEAGLPSGGRFETSQGADDDPRVIGDDEFLSRLALALQPARLACSLQELVEGCCQKLAIDAGRLTSASRNRGLSRIRLAVAHIAVTRRVASLQAVAAFFGRDESSLRKAIERIRLQPGGVESLVEFAQEISPKARTGT